MNDSMTHPKGEQPDGALIPVSGPVAVDTFGGRIHVEWIPGGGRDAVGSAAVLYRVPQAWGVI